MRLAMGHLRKFLSKQYIKKLQSRGHLAHHVFTVFSLIPPPTGPRSSARR